MRSTCISHPASEPLLIIRSWQVEFTGSHCAAALLSFFEYWHNIKLGAVGQDDSKDLWQWHNEKEILAGLLGIYKRDSVRVAIDLLVNLGVLETGRNPNPKYGFDKTRYFLFKPWVINKWLSDRANNQLPSSENRQRESKNQSTITEITPETSLSMNINTCAEAKKTEVTSLSISSVDATPTLSVVPASIASIASESAQGGVIVPPARPAVTRLFDVWREVMNKPRAQLTPDKRTKIAARLKEGYSEEFCEQAIRGCASSAFHMGDNTNGKSYNGIDLIFRNGSKLEDFQAIWESTKPKPIPFQSRAASTAKAVNNYEQWMREIEDERAALQA